MKLPSSHSLRRTGRWAGGGQKTEDGRGTRDEQIILELNIQYRTRNIEFRSKLRQKIANGGPSFAKASDFAYATPDKTEGEPFDALRLLRAGGGAENKKPLDDGKRTIDELQKVRDTIKTSSQLCLTGLLCKITVPPQVDKFNEIT
jgi:hypothetical protein